MTGESMSYPEALKEIKRLKETLNKIRAEIEEHAKINQNLDIDRAKALCWCLDVIDKYKASDTEESDAEFMCRVMSKTVNKSIADNNFIGGF